MKIKEEKEKSVMHALSKNKIRKMIIQIWLRMIYYSNLLMYLMAIIAKYVSLDAKKKRRSRWTNQRMLFKLAAGKTRHCCHAT